ncbi:spore germination cell wall hydrolase CwlJ-like protein [Pseudaminobacter salicylatoxidans]|uniref:Spore germination cell wall hydrolase CwlJ-like protein n=1 Tax=Pseudaminobacter salicylatoxidans TaxID=93369 RepID=A0A316C8T5_PSESE|nr:cell wall hydrolase [Pseudaminobacter salicylatoxidans]PWJ85476.1 spore germination cell wall hydrolase CwlJ-like protein [Pseudaminobacter salicylatoxidans]
MHRRLSTLQLAVASLKKRAFVPPLVIGLGIWIGFPTVTAYQDMRSLISGVEMGGARWNSFVESSVAGSVHAAELPFADGDTITGSMSGSGVRTPGIGAVAFRGKQAAADLTPDEERINRRDKQGRIVNVTPVAPPKAFSAGSVLKRTSSLTRPVMDGGLKMTFAKPDIQGKEVQIATAFHATEEKKAAPGVPTMLASLMNDNAPDILATAYAPSEPDYARTSPFESLLRDKDPSNGRFIPPLADGDHHWMRNPLPASVFTKKEQQCLATAIYFEAQGESPKGQAAVAQVILNRVRNPAYPNTICRVVYQNDNWRNRCQFSFACDGRKKVVTSRKHYKIAEEIALAVTAGKIFLPEVASSTHYYAAYVNPGWARTMEKMKRIGLHIFYRTYGGGWS